MRLLSSAAEIGHVVRGLLRRPAVPFVLATVIAVGVAFIVTAFSVFDALLWRDTPYGPPDRFILLGEARDRAVFSPTPRMPVDTYVLLQAAFDRGQLTPIEGLIPVEERRASLIVDGEAVSVSTARLLPTAFPLLQGIPLLGRTPADPDGPARLAREVAIGEELWTRHFGRRADVLGQQVTIDGESAVVVGVMPAAFRFYRTAELWAGWSSAEIAADPERSVLLAVRLAPGYSGRDVSPFVTPVQRAARAARTPADTTSVLQRSLNLYGPQQVPPELARTILGAMALVLVAACLNVATLYLARLRRRAPDYATRLALGGGPDAVLRHVLLEIGVVLLTGAVAAAVLTLGVLAFLHRRMDGVFLSWVELRLDERGLLVALLALGAALALVALPAVRLARRLDLSRLLTHQGVLGGAPRHGRGASTLIAAQVAVVVVLAAAALPIALSAAKLGGVQSGLADDRIVRVDVDLAGAAYASDEARLAYARRARDQLAAHPAVAGVASAAAFGGWREEETSWSDTLYTDASAEPLPRARTWRIGESVVSAGYFAVVGLPVPSGRTFQASADEAGERVAVVSAAAAELLWPGEIAVGRRFRRGAVGPWVRVVGVVGDETGIWEDWGGTTVSPDPRIYLFEPQAIPTGTTLYVRGRQPGPALVRDLRAAVEGVDPTQPVAQAQLLADTFAVHRVTRMWLAVVLGSGAAAAVVLAMTGVIGLVLFYTTARLPEFALRMAVGAPLRRVAWLAARGIVRSVGIGLVVGVLTLAIIQDGIRRFTYETSTHSPAVLVLIALTVLLVALLALVVPLRQLRRLSPRDLLSRT